MENINFDSSSTVIAISDNVIVLYPPKHDNLICTVSQTVPITCVALPDSLVFIDCGIYTDLVKKFRLDMEKKFDQETSHLFLTHSHYDHVLALEVFADVSIVISESGIREIEVLLNMIKGKSAEEWMKLLGMDKEDADFCAKLNPILPNVGIKDKYKITSDDVELIFEVIGGHSHDSSFIYIPKYGTLCAGDNLVECYHPRPGIPDDALRILQYWESLDIDKVVPGHGKDVSKEYITKLRMYYEDLLSALKNLIAQSLILKKIYTNPSIPEYFGKDQKDWIPGAWTDSNWAHETIRIWYKHIKHATKRV